MTGKDERVTRLAGTLEWVRSQGLAHEMEWPGHRTTLLNISTHGEAALMMVCDVCRWTVSAGGPRENAPMSQPPDLAEFLLARIAEDERDWMPLGDSIEMLNGQFVDWAARVLAECEAKRRIVELADKAWDDSGCTECNEAGGLGDQVLKLLVLPYADHEDFREEWRP